VKEWYGFKEFAQSLRYPFRIYTALREVVMWC